MFSLQNQCNGLVDRARTILSQFIRLQNYPLFPVTEKSDRLTQFTFQDKVQERSMMLLLRLNPMRFSQVSHSRIIGVFHDFIKRLTIPEIQLKQYALANFLRIISALGAF